MHRKNQQQLSQLLQSGLAFHQRGELAEAQKLYDQILKLQSKHFDALQLSATIATQTKNYQRAAELFDIALTINNNHSGLYNNRGIALKELKRLDEALVSFNKAIKLKPDYSDAYYNCGNVLQELNQLDEALASYDKAIALMPNYAEAYCNRGSVLRKLNQLDAGLDSCDKAITIKPSYAEAYNHRGVALKDLNRLDEALASYDTAILLKPDFAEAYYNRGNVLMGLHQLNEAVVNYETAIALKPYLSEAYHNRGAALKDLKQLDAALASYEEAIKLKADYADAYYNRGNLLQELDQLNEALVSYDTAIGLKSGFADAYFNRGNLLRDLRQLNSALKSYEQALHFDCEYKYALGALQHTKMHMCDWRDSDQKICAILQKITAGQKSSDPFITLSLTDDLAIHQQSAQILSRAHSADSHSLAKISKRHKGTKIRVGYYSADFHNHATAYLIAGLFEAHNKDKFELIAFSFGPVVKNEMRSRLSMAFDQFIDVRNQTDQAVAQLSRDIGIDIGIDLKGYTTDSRPGVFACRAAPVQVNYLGYPATMGADYMDYIVADHTLVPKDSQKYYSEKMVYLPNTYQVNDRKRAISANQFTRQELGLPDVGFVFCCFNNNYKILPTTFDGWMRILRTVEGSVLWLLEDNHWASTNLRREAENRGVAANRLVFAKRMPLPEHLARHNQADLFLDTFPCNAHTTTSDALWSGLPLLTLMGESFPSRVAASLLNAIHLPELITRTQGEYEALAIELATNPERLAAIKQKLASNRLTTPLFDTQLFAQHIEAAYTQMMERYWADLPPDHIVVSC